MRSGARTLVGCASGLVVATLMIAAPTVAPAGAADATCRGRPATIVGTAGDDVLVGTPGHDVIAGLAGDDRISGRGGDDLICGGDGSDTISGGPGEDRLYGNLDGLVERMSNGGGIFYVLVGDVVQGGAGDDRIDLGYDERDGREKPDTIRLTGQRGTYFQMPLDGRRAIAVGHGWDVVFGQPEMVVIGSPGPDHIWGTPGDDDITGGAGDDVIRGRGGDDWIRDAGWPGRGSGNDRLTGGPGDDTVISRTGQDVVGGGPGNDHLYAGPRTKLRGGDSADWLYYDRAGRGCVTVLGGDGRDTLELRPFRSAGGSVRVDLDRGTVGGCGLVDNVETTRLLPAHGDAPAPEWRLRGTNHTDRVYVLDAGRLLGNLRGGNDVFFGGPGNDVVEGGPGRDRVDGNLGDDTCTGFEVVTGCETT